MSDVTVKVSEETAAHTVEATALAISALDGSRRVAWAKMYAALKRGEEAERELATKREDAVLLSRFAGFSYGVFEGLGIKDVYKTYIPNGDLNAASSYFEQGAINAGRDIGRNWRSEFPERVDLVKVQAKLGATRERLAELRSQAEQLERDRIEFKRTVRRDLMEQFDIPTDAEFFDWLTQYREKGKAS